jgi:thiol-disulfide isomerase/thioredoxin
MNTRKLLLLVAVLLAVMGGAYAVHRVGSSSQSPARAPVNDPNAPVVRLVKNPMAAPPLAMQDLNGNPVSSADWAGKVVLLNFWATWCPPCRKEIPELIGLQKKYGKRLLVIGISEDEDGPDKVRQFAKDNQINYPIVMATPELIDAYGGVPALPTTFVLNQQGRVVQKHAGLYPEDSYHREIQVLLDLPTDARVETFEDTGQVFLQNSANATELPEVDFTGLTPQQKKVALRRVNAESCTCGCGLTLSQCRINDTVCPTSRKLAADVVAEVRNEPENEVLSRKAP